jgi:hypothetical protein
MPPACREITQLQHGVVSRAQAMSCGMSPDVIDRLLRAERWLPLRRGIYSIYTGEPSREATLWAAVLLAGKGAALSHQTAAELFKITDQPSSLIHVTIPHCRRMSAAAGVVIHRSSRIAEAIHPALLPPRTRVEETVLDLADQATTFEVAFGVICVASQRRLTTGDRLGEVIGRRKKMRWRAELSEALGLIGTGVHSLLEYRYVRFVEHPHGLPRALRQAKIVAGGPNRYLDNLYHDYSLCVELDGRQAHPEDQRWQDLHRVNALTELGLTTLRYGWTDIDRRPCQTAVQIAVVLRDRGWSGPVRRCSHACPAGSLIRETAVSP